MKKKISAFILAVNTVGTVLARYYFGIKNGILPKIGEKKEKKEEIIDALEKRIFAFCAAIQVCLAGANIAGLIDISWLIVFIPAFACAGSITIITLINEAIRCSQERKRG